MATRSAACQDDPYFTRSHPTPSPASVTGKSQNHTTANEEYQYAVHESLVSAILIKDEILHFDTWAGMPALPESKYPGTKFLILNEYNAKEVQIPTLSNDLQHPFPRDTTGADQPR
jgi:hypothetical protein